MTSKSDDAGKKEAGFTRLNKVNFDGVLTDIELEHLLSRALADAGVLKRAHEQAAYVREVTTGKVVDATDERLMDIHYNFFGEIRRLALSIYPQSKPGDWAEIQFQIRDYGAERWLADLPHIKNDKGKPSPS